MQSIHCYTEPAIKQGTFNAETESISVKLSSMRKEKVFVFNMVYLCVLIPIGLIFLRAFLSLISLILRSLNKSSGLLLFQSKNPFPFITPFFPASIRLSMFLHLTSNHRRFIAFISKKSLCQRQPFKVYFCHYSYNWHS